MRVIQVTRHSFMCILCFPFLPKTRKRDSFT
jgi:hypothetical protein